MKLLAILILVMLQLGFSQQAKDLGTCSGRGIEGSGVYGTCMDESGTLWSFDSEDPPYYLWKVTDSVAIQKWYTMEKDSMISTVKGSCSSECTISWRRGMGSLHTSVVYKERFLFSKVLEFHDGVTWLLKRAKKNYEKCENSFVFTIQKFYASGSLYSERGKQNAKCETIEKEYFEDGRLAGTSIYKNVELVGYKKCTDGRQGNEELDCTTPPIKK